MAQELQAAGADTQMIAVVNPEGAVLYNGEPISAALDEGGNVVGYHVGVESDGLVYDAANPNGVPINNWGPFTGSGGNTLSPGVTNIIK